MGRLSYKPANQPILPGDASSACEETAELYLHRSDADAKDVNACKLSSHRWGRAICLMAVVAACSAVALHWQRDGVARLRHQLAGTEEERFEQPFQCPDGKWLGKPDLWKPVETGKPMQVKVLVYNLFWWWLFKDHGGKNGSAGKLIKKHSEPRFDFMGFQECLDIHRVFNDAGLHEEYELHQGPYGKCIAMHKGTWTRLTSGHTVVAEDTYWNWYGKRGVQWMRAKHQVSGKHVFFMNYHGALSVNSGGKCGGWTTAHSLLKVAQDNAKRGDIIIFVGDFNSNLASTLLQELRKHLMHVYNGLVYGGVDNVFSNAESESIVSTTKLGKGGSDHDAISIVFKFGQKHSKKQLHEAPGIKGAVMALKKENKKMGHASICDCDCSWNKTMHACDKYDDSCCAFCCCRDGKFTSTPTKKGALCTKAPIDWSVFWCGLMENGAEYLTAPGGWRKSEEHMNPDWCCKRCQETRECKAWTWNVYPHQFYNASVMGHCQLLGGKITGRKWREGFVSGYAAPAATAMAERKSHALSFL